VTIDELMPVAAAVAEALRIAGVRLQPEQIEPFERSLCAGLLPLLDEPSRRQVAAEGREWAIASGRAVMVVDEDGRQSYWRGEGS
jgi:hypothetical protein